MKAKCAHLTVIWTTEDAGSGLTRGWWECKDCDMLFSPRIDRDDTAELAALRQEVDDLKAKQRNLMSEIDTHRWDNIQLRNEGDALRQERDALKEKQDEWIAVYDKVINDRCASDEVHCGCVPFLRERVRELEAQSKAAEIQINGKHKENEWLLNENNALQAVVDAAREALIGMLEIDGIDHDSPQVFEANAALRDLSPKLEISPSDEKEGE